MRVPNLEEIIEREEKSSPNYTEEDSFIEFIVQQAECIDRISAIWKEQVVAPFEKNPQEAGLSQNYWITTTIPTNLTSGNVPPTLFFPQVSNSLYAPKIHHGF